MKLQLGEKQVDLNDAFPLTIGDIKALETIGVIDNKEEMNAGSVTMISKLVFHLARKVDSEVTEAEIDAIPVHKLKDLGPFLDSKMKEVGIDRPT